MSDSLADYVLAFKALAVKSFLERSFKG